jgi:hypothetical protein
MAAAIVSIGALRLPVPGVLPMAIPFSIALIFAMRRRGPASIPTASWDLTLVAALGATAAAVLAFATRLSPIWILLARGCLGFAGVI